MKSGYFLVPILCFILLLPSQLIAQTFVLHSPSEKAEVIITVGKEISYSINYTGTKVVSSSKFGLQFSQARYFGEDLRVIDHEEATVNETWQPVVGSFSTVTNHYNQLLLTLKERSYPERMLVMAFRAYDDGIALRYRIPESWNRFIPNYEQSDRLTLVDERTTFNFDQDHTVWAADYRTYASHQEEEFRRLKMNEIDPGQVIGLPFLVQVNSICYAALMEADLTDWAGMYLKKVPRNDTFCFIADLSPLPDNPEEKVKVLPGSWSPWRVVMLGDQPGALIESEIIHNLNDPCAIEDPSWITPGISAWDHWWSGEVQMDTETIKAYIDLADEMNWEYMLIDWHWYGPPFITEGVWRANPEADITMVNPAVDMESILDYAKDKEIKLVLWLLWEHAEQQMEEAFALYESWGISGVKIDFMARDDQEMVNWYHKIVKKAAEHHLVVDFHGAYKPTGWSRTWPNLITREGVLGNEYSKWSSRITPEHNVTLPFTRMLAGHMDYTPGGFLNVTAEEFRNGAPAQVMSTRAHQLAMFVVYYSPYTVACDHPDHYRNQPGAEFLKGMPASWDESRVLSGEIGDHIVMARRKGDRWYIGGMNNSHPKTITIPLDFIPEGKHNIYYFRDTTHSNETPTSIEMGNERIDAGSFYSIKMEKGGGFAAYIDIR